MRPPKKSLGQNFLIDKNILKKISNLEIIKNKNILEIGPGTGNLTTFIIEKKPANVILIEKDRFLFNDLKKKLIKKNNVTIFNDDILKVNLENIIKPKSIIIGNLPYNISSQILVKFVKIKIWPPNFDKLIFMFQKEVADRILAKYNSKNYGRLSVISSYRLKIIDKINISSNSFFPKPKVESTILIFEPIKNPMIKIKNIDNLEKITQSFFSFKRKMIGKIYKKLFSNNKKILDDLKLNLSQRPSELSSDTYYKLTKFYEEN